MCRLKDFLKKYDTVIFDMDGVMTQEQQYWTSAALVVYELINSKDYFGSHELNAEEISRNTKKIRADVFQNDRLISILKNKGVNSNWDLAYVVFALGMINEGNFERALDNAENFSENILDEYAKIGNMLSDKLSHMDCKRNGQIWQMIHMCFQEWFLGDELFFEVYKKKTVLSGKKGLCYSETPLIDGEKLKKIFSLLKENNIKAGIATGRPDAEAKTPLKSFGIIDFIDEKSIITYDYVKAGEKKTGENLTKPHPYMFVKAMLGEDYPDEKIIKGEYPKEKIKSTLAVGDAGADILSAHCAGMDFCAVLTGVAGKSAKEYFEEEQAEYILNSLEDFLDE